MVKFYRTDDKLIHELDTLRGGNLDTDGQPFCCRGTDGGG